MDDEEKQHKGSPAYNICEKIDRQASVGYT